MSAAADLIAKLDDEDASTRQAAADALVALGGTAAVPGLVEALRRVSPSPQYTLLTGALRRIGPGAFDAVCVELEAAGSQSGADRHRWFSVLTNMGVRALPLYIRALQHPADTVRSAALAGLGNLKVQALPAAPNLIEMLSGADQALRSRLIHLLYTIGDDVIPLLQDVRRRGPGRARAAALTCLADLGGESVLSREDRAALERLVRIKLQDDRPQPISCCFLSWMAVSTGDRGRLMEFLGLSVPRPATFALGIAAADSDSHANGGEHFEHLSRVFVTPTVAGWTLVVGAWTDPSNLDRAAEVLELCARASAVFGKAQAYWYGAQNDGSAWLIAENGKVVRRASAIDDAVDEQLGLGVPLPEEDMLLEGVDDEFDRDFLLMEFAIRLAEKLSIDPLALRSDTACSGIGQLALTPIGAVHGHPAGALYF